VVRLTVAVSPSFKMAIIAWPFGQNFVMYVRFNSRRKIAKSHSNLSPTVLLGYLVGRVEQRFEHSCECVHAIEISRFSKDHNKPDHDV
jgi:hypothetical protein